MFVDGLLVLVLQLLPALQVGDVLYLLGGGAGLLQLLEDALDVVPLLHVPGGLAERVRHHLADTHHALRDLLLALLAARRAALGVLHDEPLLRHVRWRCGERPTPGRGPAGEEEESVRFCGESTTEGAGNTS